MSTSDHADHRDEYVNHSTSPKPVQRQSRRTKADTQMHR